MAQNMPQNLFAWCYFGINNFAELHIASLLSSLSYVAVLKRCWVRLYASQFFWTESGGTIPILSPHPEKWGVRVPPVPTDRCPWSCEVNHPQAARSVPCHSEWPRHGIRPCYSRLGGLMQLWTQKDIMLWASGGIWFATVRNARRVDWEGKLVQA